MKTLSMINEERWLLDTNNQNYVNKIKLNRWLLNCKTQRDRKRDTERAIFEFICRQRRKRLLAKGFLVWKQLALLILATRHHIILRSFKQWRIRYLMTYYLGQFSKYYLLSKLRRCYDHWKASTEALRNLERCGLARGLASDYLKKKGLSLIHI